MPVDKNNTSIVSFIKYWLPVVIYAILIFSFSSIPGQDLPKLFKGQDIILHIIEYTFFALLINRAIKKYYPKEGYLKRILWVFMLAFFYAITDEFHQSFTPGRLASGFDVSIDAAGGLLGSLIYR